MNDTMKSETTAVPTGTAITPKAARIIVQDESDFALMLDTARFEHVQRVAALYADSDFVTDAYRGKVSNCAVAIQSAIRLHVDPVLFMQHSYLVHGKPGIEGQLVIALINARGPFTGPLQWKSGGEGDSRFWTCYATHKRTGELCQRTITWALVKAEGWDKKAGSKWLTMADQMGCYRSASWFGRLYCPEVLLGFPTVDELEDIGERVITGERVDLPAVRMPQAKGSGTGEPLPDLGTTISANGPTAPPVQHMVFVDSAGGAGGERMITEPRVERPAGATLIDRETGEIATEPAENGPVASDLGGERVPPPEASAAAPEAPNAAMSKPASDAQKRAIENTAKRLGLSASQVDEIIADATGFNLASLPQGAVNDALKAIASRK